MELEAAVAGGTDFEDFVRARQHHLLKVAWLLTGSEEAAQDLVQVTLIRVWPKWPRLQAGGDPERYTMSALYNAHRSAWRRAARTPRVSSVRAEVDSSAVWDTRQALVDALRRLSKGQRAVIVLRYFEELSEAETARTLNCTVGTVESQASRGLAMLRSDPHLRQAFTGWGER